MWKDFFFTQFHFSLYLFTALTFFSVFWLYFDAWHGQRTKANLFHFLGFLLLSLSFLLKATSLESVLITTPFISTNYRSILDLVFTLGGYIFIILASLITRFNLRPK